VTFYLDTSALVKLLVPEPESAPLRDYLRRHGRTRRSASALVRTELRRAAGRVSPELQPAVEKLLSGLALLRVDDALLDTAGRLAPAGLRPLGALHLASALRVPALTAFIAYDERLLSAARELGLPAIRPS
jgi:predicted nucleic acid-binding protein